MTFQEIPSTIRQMTAYDLLTATILTKPGSPHFKEEALEFGLRQAVAGNRRLEQRLFTPRCDGSSPEHPNSIEASLGMMNGFHILEYAGDYQTMHMPEEMRKLALTRLKERYGNNVLEEVTPFAAAVWEAAGKYTH